MAQPTKAPAPPAAPKLKARVKVEILGSWRDPIAKRGDVIEITREEFDKHGPEVFEDVALAEQIQAEATKGRIDPDFETQRVRLRAEREASYRAAASRRRQEAEAALRAAEEMEKRAGVSRGD